MSMADELPEPEPEPANEEPSEEQDSDEDEEDDKEEEEDAEEEGGCSHFTGIDLGLSMLPLLCFGWVVVSYRKRDADAE